MEFLNTHCKNVLECKSILPIFRGKVPRTNVMTIDALFVQLFQIGEECPSLSQLLIEIGRLITKCALPNVLSSCKT